MSGERTREYQAIVWIKGSTAAPMHLSIEAGTAAAVRQIIHERFGEFIDRCSIWNDEEVGATWTRPRPNDTLREFKAIVWTKDPTVAGRRLTVIARNVDEATQMAKLEFGEEADFCYAWNDDDANKVR